jgi:hypothetical protein
MATAERCTHTYMHVTCVRVTRPNKIMRPEAGAPMQTRSSVAAAQLCTHAHTHKHTRARAWVGGC